MPLLFFGLGRRDWDEPEIEDGVLGGVGEKNAPAVGVKMGAQCAVNSGPRRREKWGPTK